MKNKVCDCTGLVVVDGVWPANRCLRSTSDFDAPLDLFTILMRKNKGSCRARNNTTQTLSEEERVC